MNLTAKQVSIMAISAAIYAIFFFLSGLVTVPNFTILYLPIVLLGVFPIWFGLSGLAGSMIGAFIGGAFVEGLGFLGVFEAVTAFIIYCLVWLLMPRNVAEGKCKENLVLLNRRLRCQPLCWNGLYPLAIHCVTCFVYSRVCNSHSFAHIRFELGYRNNRLPGLS